MITKKFDLATIEALAMQTEYGGLKTVSSLTSAMLLCVLSGLADLNLWQGVDYTLSDEEIDTIKAMVAAAVDELLEGEEEAVGSLTKLAEVSSIANVNNLSTTGLDTSGYEILKVFITGIKTSYSFANLDHLVLKLEGAEQSSLYSTMGDVQYWMAQNQYKTSGTVTGFVSYYSATTITSYDGVWGNIEYTIYQAEGAGYKHLKYTSQVGGPLATHNIMGLGTGTCLLPDTITNIQIRPFSGNNFIIDPANDAHPRKLKMAVFGLE